MLEVRYYLATDGKSPFEGWFSDLDAAAAAKVGATVHGARDIAPELGGYPGKGEIGRASCRERVCGPV